MCRLCLHPLFYNPCESERRLLLVLILCPCDTCFRDGFLTLNHRVHMVDKRSVFRITVYHRQRVHRIHQRAVGSFGGGAGLLHDAHLTGCIGFRALGGCGKELFFFIFQVFHPDRKVDFGDGQCLKVLQEVVQHAAFLGLRQLRGVAVFVEHRLALFRE